MLILKNWDRERGFVKPASRFPVADLYLCWAPDAVYLGLFAMDTPEPASSAPPAAGARRSQRRARARLPADGGVRRQSAYYRDGQVPEVDRMEWVVHLQGQRDPLRVHLGAGRGPALAAAGVTVASPPSAGGVGAVAIMKIPAATFGRAKLSAGDRLQFTSTLTTHARAYRVGWAGKFSLAK